MTAGLGPQCQAQVGDNHRCPHDVVPGSRWCERHQSRHSRRVPRPQFDQTPTRYAAIHHNQAENLDTIEFISPGRNGVLVACDAVCHAAGLDPHNVAEWGMLKSMLLACVPEED